MSLVCDFKEIYRYLIDDFLIQYCQKISKRDFNYKALINEEALLFAIPLRGDKDMVSPNARKLVTRTINN